MCQRPPGCIGVSLYPRLACWPSRAPVRRMPAAPNWLTAYRPRRIGPPLLFLLQIPEPLLDQRDLGAAGLFVQVRIGARERGVFRAAVNDRAFRVDRVDPLHAEKAGVAVVAALREVALERPHRPAAAAERAVEHGERLGEARIRRPLAHRFLENRPGGPEV